MQQILGASLLGFGFNSLGSYDSTATTKSILTPTGGNSGTYTDPFSRTTYIVPNNVAVTPGTGDSTQEASAAVFQSQQAFQSFFAAKAGISGSYRGFSGEFNLAFGTESQSQSMNWYSVASGSFQSWTLLLQEAGQGQLSSDFSNDPDVQAMMQQTSFNSGNAQTFYRVFQKWGTHFIDQVILGGEFNYFAAVSASYSSDQTTISSNLSLEYKAVFVSAKAQAQAEWQSLGQTWTNDRQVSWSATGGDNSLLSGVPVEPGYEQNFSQAYQTWAQSLATNPAVVGFHLTAISNLFSGDLATAINVALNSYLNLGVYAQAQFSSGSPTNTEVIQLNDTTLNNPAVAPPEGSEIYGVAQLVVFDGVTLDVLVNVGGYCYYYNQEEYVPWEAFYSAVENLTQNSYIAVLAVSDFPSHTGYPTPDFVQWLAGCGANLQAWTGHNVYCGDDFSVDYVMVGQQGLQVGSAFEKLAWSGSLFPPPPGTIFFANVTAALTPPIASGQPYRLYMPTGPAPTTARRVRERIPVSVG